MCHVLKSDWTSNISLKALKARAKLYKKIRSFFEVRDVLEVETPLLAPYTIPDPNIPSIEAYYQPDINRPAQRYYLQTSPEFAMKRLLASGFDSMYQLGKAFRNDYCGSQHNPEFSLLEWYRVGFDHHELMGETDLFFQHILRTPAAEKQTYQALFMEHLAVDPLLATVDELKQCATHHQASVSDELMAIDDKDTWLNFLMAYFIEPTLGLEKPMMIYNYPASQAALARLEPQDAHVAQRFEVFYKGRELANGFCELNSSEKQCERFKLYQQQSQLLGLPVYELDQRFLQSLDYLPACAGVAIGLDRLLMLQLDLAHIDDVLVFPFNK